MPNDDKKAFSDDLFFPLVERNYWRSQEQRQNEIKREIRRTFLESVASGFIAGGVFSIVVIFVILAMVVFGVL